MSHTDVLSCTPCVLSRDTGYPFYVSGQPANVCTNACVFYPDTQGLHYTGGSRVCEGTSPYIICWSGLILTRATLYCRYIKPLLSLCLMPKCIPCAFGWDVKCCDKTLISDQLGMRTGCVSTMDVIWPPIRVPFADSKTIGYLYILIWFGCDCRIYHFSVDVAISQHS